MNCTFCHKPCENYSFYKPARFPYLKNKESWDCNNCSVQIRFMIYPSQNNKICSISFFPRPAGPIGGIIYLEENQAEFWFPINNQIQHIKLDYIPDWTPSNFVEKLNLYLTFS